MKYEDIKYKIEQIEDTEVLTFCDTHPNAKDKTDISNMENYLYHGVRFDNSLKKFENILKTGKISCGKRNPYYFHYDDNCNEGEYVSLLEYNVGTKSMFNVFITRTISFVLFPDIGAIKTDYLPFNEWHLLVDMGNLKHRYSYANGEYQVKDFIPIENVAAIGIPKAKMEEDGSGQYAMWLLEKVPELLDFYGINLPIVDPSNGNSLLISNQKYAVDVDLLQDLSSCFSNDVRKNRVRYGYKVYRKSDIVRDNARSVACSSRKY